jgi:MerR family transcriptional regulator, mercuric resistance operon regulatory protein
MKNQPQHLPVGAFAAAAGVNVETIRFYQRKGLLPRPRRAYGSIRRYGASDVARVKFVKSAQRLGFSLEEIAGLLALEDGTHCNEARVAAEQKLEDVRAKLDDLRRIESVLAQLVERCCASRGTITCPLIAALHAH